VEHHIVPANQYRIAVDGDMAGYCSILQTNVLTQYHLLNPFKRYGQHVFQHVKQLEFVRAALVSTGDAFFLAHALDEHRQIELHAYHFQVANPYAVPDLATDLSIWRAALQDVALIQERTEDFFGDVAGAIDKGQLYVVYRGELLLGVGVIVQGQLNPDVASVGMYTLKQFRQQGIGTYLIKNLIRECQQQGLRVFAGCDYDNHGSKKTLERAGMYSYTRMLRISF
jgi:GNAT superfamily N-acetyltransferase